MRRRRQGSQRLPTRLPNGSAAVLMTPAPPSTMPAPTLAAMPVLAAAVPSGAAGCGGGALLKSSKLTSGAAPAAQPEPLRERSARS